jgi:hypothetical protein
MSKWRVFRPIPRNEHGRRMMECPDSDVFCPVADLAAPGPSTDRQYRENLANALMRTIPNQLFSGDPNVNTQVPQQADLATGNWPSGSPLAPSWAHNGSPYDRKLISNRRQILSCV